MKKKNRLIKALKPPRRQKLFGGHCGCYEKQAAFEINIIELNYRERESYN
jgi:hypothetical protein